MLEVSDEIKNLYASTSQPKHLIIYFPDLEYEDEGVTTTGFTVPDANIKFESMELDESICEDDYITFVGCVSSKFTVTLYNISYNLKGQKIEVSMTIGDTATSIPLFNGWVSEVELETNRAYKDITAYDAIYSKISGLDVADWYNDLTFPTTVGSLRASLFRYMQLYQFIDVYEVETTLPNDSLEISRNYVPDTLDALDVIKSICQINGVFGIINRQGNFEYRLINSETVLDFSTNYKEATYQELALTPTERIIIRANSSKTGVGYPISATTNKYIIQSNIFMASYTSDTVTERAVAKNVFDSIGNITYRPFEATNYGAPWIECGDTVSYTMYDFEASAAQGVDVWVTASYTILKRHMSGIQNLFDEFSADGNEDTTQFISDIGLSWEVTSDSESSSSSTSDSAVAFYTYLSSNQHVISAGGEEQVAYANYRCTKGAFMVMHAEIELDMNGNTDVEIYYKNRPNHNASSDVISDSTIIPNRTVVGNVLHLDYFFTSIITSRAAFFEIYIKNNNATAITVLTGRMYILVKGSLVKLSSIEVAQEPDKVLYARNDPLDFTGLVVNAIYTDGTVEEITDVCSYDPTEGSPAELDWTSVNIYLYDDVTYSTSFGIEVYEANTELISGTDINAMLISYYD